MARHCSPAWSFSVSGSVGYQMGDTGNVDLSLQTFGEKGSQASLSYSKRF
jgi:hypothetical protein